MPTLFEQAEAFRAAVLRRERRPILHLIDAYADIWRTLKAQLADLTAEMPDDADAGWLLSQGRYLSLLAQVEREVARLAPGVTADITATQAELVALAQEHATALARTALGPAPEGIAVGFDQVPARALEHLVGFMQDNLPLRYKLPDLAPDAVARVKKALIVGVGTGQGPQVIARDMRDALGGNMQQAITIARTETLYAYRASTIQFGQANSQVVEGWVWLSRRSVRTCSACWAMDGSFHTNDEPFGSHARCACVPVPRTKSWKQLGYDVPDRRPDLGTGAAVFAKLPAADQERILGTAKYAAFKDGTIGLADTVHTVDDPHWGVTRQVASLAQATANAGR